MIRSSNIPNQFYKVERPNHPYIYSGPDLILTDKRNLFAIFIPKKSEYKNRNRLHLRLFNSRICYPSKTMMVLIMNEKNAAGERNVLDRELYDLDSRLFDTIIEQKDLKKLNTLTDEKPNDYYQKELTQIQRRLFNFQSMIYLNNLKYIAATDFNTERIPRFIDKFTKEKYFNLFSKKHETVRTNIFKYNGNIVGFKNFARKRSPLQELKPFFEYAIKSTFSFKDKIPYFENIDVKFLRLNKIPKMKYDPIKPIRIASLFGWLITNDLNNEQLEKRIKSINSNEL